MNAKRNKNNIKIIVCLVSAAMLLVLGAILLMNLTKDNTRPVENSAQVAAYNTTTGNKEATKATGDSDLREVETSEAMRNSLKENGTAENTRNDESTVKEEKAAESSVKDQRKVSEPVSGSVTKNDEKPLEGLVIGIDPGHQSKGNNTLEKIAPDSEEMKAKVTSGTRGKYTGVPEYKLNLEVGLLLKAELQDLGAKTVMTRETDNIDISNVQRAQLTNENNCHMVIRIHANGSESAESNGYSILVPGEKYSKDIAGKSRSFAEVLDSALRDNIDIRREGIITRNDLTGFNWSETPVVLLEMGYMTNKHDDETMQTEKFKKGVVKAISHALQVYFKGKK